MMAMIATRAKKAEDVQSPDRPRSYVSIAKRKHILLKSVGNLRTRRTGKIIMMVRHLLSSVLVQILEIV
jgi:hypothetical protein